MPVINYYQNKPLATDKLNTSQSDLFTNFGAINTWTGIDHLNFGNGNAGKHDKVQLPPIASGIQPAVVATELALYNFLNPTTAANELYVKKVGIAGAAGIPMTARGGTTAGWTYLPSGLLVKWGTITTTAASSVTLNAVAGPSFNAAIMPFAAFVTAQQTTFGPAAGFLYNGAANPLLAVRTLTAGCPCYWIVVGV
jgi:hypothetical protein